MLTIVPVYSGVHLLQHIQQLIRKNPLDVEAILDMPDGQEEGVWKYEHLR